ncbi:hypothetical protein ACWGM4_15250, partial [Streptomyces albidoflavus]
MVAPVPGRAGDGAIRATALGPVGSFRAGRPARAVFLEAMIVIPGHRRRRVPRRDRVAPARPPPPHAPESPRTGA